MKVIHIQALVHFGRKHSDARDWLESWLATANKANWQNLRQVCEVYPHADGVKLKSGAVVTVFNVCGNKYRLLTLISYRAQVMEVIGVMTHAEYSKERWKNSV